MTKIVIALPTKSTDDPCVTQGVDFLQRLRSPFIAHPVFIPPKNSSHDPQRRMQQEGTLLLERTTGHFRIALAADGKQYSSTQLVTSLEKLFGHTPKIAFIIGGAFGLSKEVIHSCDKTLSLSPMTLPHRLAFLVLCEQLYRAYEIMRGSPYHK